MNYLSIRTLGREGRWGNQLFAVAFGLGLARKFSCPLILPDDWIGRKIFKNDIPGVIWESYGKLQSQFHFGQLQTTYIDNIPSESQFYKSQQIDLFGYWQFQDCLDLYTEEDVRNWFKWHEWVKEKFPFTANTDIVVHKRRGDYVRQPHLYCNILNESFDKATHLILKDSPDSRIVVLEEENPEKDEYCDRENIGFLPDFMRMVHAKYVVRSNSTFSWWPTVFGKNQVVAPLVEDNVGWYNPEWVMGNWPRMADSKYHPNSKLTDLYLRDK